MLLDSDVFCVMWEKERSTLRHLVIALPLRGDAAGKRHLCSPLDIKFWKWEMDYAILTVPITSVDEMRTGDLCYGILRLSFCSAEK